MNVFLEKILAPLTNQMKLVNVAETWDVRWTSRTGAFYSDMRPEVEVFVTEAEAQHFKTALENAYKLLRIRGEGTDVNIYRKSKNR